MTLNAGENQDAITRKKVPSHALWGPVNHLGNYWIDLVLQNQKPYILKFIS